jgi:hypothetical protein
MYIEHPFFISPREENTMIWRYMSFTKFVSLLESGCLFFSRADKLGDPFEGSWPMINISSRLESPKELPAESRGHFIEMMKDISSIMKQLPRSIAVNCWHMNEYESAAMWKLYLEGNEGIAVQSTFKRLKDSLIDEQEIYLGMVKYINYQTEGIDPRFLMSPFMHKRKSFEHEREVRALVMKIPITDNKVDFFKESISLGINVKVDLEILVERLYVAPYSPIWFEELVRSIVRKYGRSFEIKHSGLDEPPLF